MNYELTKNYFKVVDETINYKNSAIVGGIGFAFLLIPNATFRIIGIALIASAIFLVVSKKNKISTEKNSIPSDSQYDSEVAKKLTGMKERALSKLGLDETEVQEIAPISFDGYVYKGAGNFKKGNDNLYRTDKYEYVMLFFSANEVHCYRYRFKTTEDIKNEGTEVYFYNDIVSANTDSAEAKFGKETINYEYFKLVTAGGTALEVSLKDVDGVQKSINAMRALLREKKQR